MEDHFESAAGLLVNNLLFLFVALGPFFQISRFTMTNSLFFRYLLFQSLMTLLMYLDFVIFLQIGEHVKW